MTTIILILIVVLVICLIIMLFQREAIKVLEGENKELTSEKSKISNSVRIKGTYIDKLEKQNKKLLSQLNE